MVPPTNQTKLEGEKVQFSCEAKALPGNVTVRWFREGAPVTEVSALDTRVSIKMDGSLVINPVSADDSGQYLCEVTNGIGDPQSASAYLNVECKIYYFRRLSLKIIAGTIKVSQKIRALIQQKNWADFSFSKVFSPKSKRYARSA